MQYKWWSRGITLAVWALAVASVAWWGLRLVGAQGQAVLASPAASVAEVAVDPAAVARLLGAAPAVEAAAPATLSSRLALLGVVAGPSNRGAALISVDGKPARPYRAGGKIEEGLYLLAVEPRRARLGTAPDAEASLVLEMPPLRK